MLFVFFIIIYSSSAQTNVGGIINTNTIWTLDKSPYNMISNIQIAQDIILTVEPGVKIIGNNKNLEVWGTIKAIGNESQKIQFQTVYLTAKQNGDNRPATLELNGIRFESGSIKGGPRNVIILIKNSSLKNILTPIDIYIPGANCFIENNVFVNCSSITTSLVGSNRVYVRYNSFYSQNSSCIINYGNKFQSSDTAFTIVSYNSFLSKEKIAAESPTYAYFYNSGLDLSNNYWNTNDAGIIQSMILDKNDDLNRLYPINYLPYLNSPHAATPFPVRLTSFNDNKTVEAGSTQTISWDSWGISKIKLEYSTSSYSPVWKTIVSGINGDLLSYQWKVPIDLSNDCIMRISNAEDAQLVFTNTSTFSITAPSSCTLTSSSNPTSGGSTNGDGTYNYGTQVQLTAIPSTGYTFTGWSGDASGSTNPLTVTMDGNKNITANFTKTIYLVILSANPTSGGTVTGAGSYEFNSTVTVVATAKNIIGSKFLFTNWTENGNEISKSNSYSFTITSNRNLIANFQDITSVENENEIPTSYSLSQNFPNPFNPSTNIQFAIPKESLVVLKVYDVLGNEISTLVNKNLPTGKYAINYNASKLNNGVYFYRLQANHFIKTNKMILLK